MRVMNKQTPHPHDPQLLRIRPPIFFPLPALPTLPFRHLAPRVFLSHDQSSQYIRSAEEVGYRLAAPPVGKEVISGLPVSAPPATQLLKCHMTTTRVGRSFHVSINNICSFINAYDRCISTLMLSLRWSILWRVTESRRNFISLIEVLK